MSAAKCSDCDRPLGCRCVEHVLRAKLKTAEGEVKTYADALGQVLDQRNRFGDERDRLREEMKRLTLETATRAELVVALSYQPCAMDVEGTTPDFSCDETGACLTEWCWSCQARAALNPQEPNASR